MIVIDRDAGRLYEMGNSYPQADGSWRASGGAVFHLDSNAVRPTAQPGWTSADAAGLPIFPGLVRYDEAALGPGGIRHALRFTVSRTRRAYVPPATHWASSNTSADLPPMGMRVRLKASYVIPAGFSAETRAILTALKTYGMMVADNGSNWYLSGAPDERWNNDRLVSELGQVRGPPLRGGADGGGGDAVGAACARLRKVAPTCACRGQPSAIGAPPGPAGGHAGPDRPGWSANHESFWPPARAWQAPEAIISEVSSRPGGTAWLAVATAPGGPWPFPGAGA